jgi:hypothetical protein
MHYDSFIAVLLVSRNDPCYTGCNRGKYVELECFQISLLKDTLKNLSEIRQKRYWVIQFSS